MTVERLRWSVLDTDIMWDKEKDSRFLSIIGCAWKSEVFAKNSNKAKKHISGSQYQ